MFELVWKSKQSEQRVEIEPDRCYRIGRSADCEVFVEDPFISAEHAEARLKKKRLMVRKTKGRNPLRVDGEFLVDDAQIKPGGEFSIGETQFTFQSAVSPLDSDLPERTQLLSTLDVLGVVDVSAEKQPSSSSSKASGTSVQLLGNLSDLLAQADDNDALANAILALACRRLDATRALLARVTGPDSISIFASRGFPADTALPKLVTTSVLRRIVVEKQAVLIGNTADPDSGLGSAESIHGNRIKAVACTPILDRNAQIGAILYVDNQERVAEFSEAEGEFLIWIGQLYRLLAANLELRRRLEAEVVQLKIAASGAKMIAESPSMIALLDRARKAAAVSSPVLLLGETGTGKECLARFIHLESSRATGPFIALNCAAIPETLFESEMFGHCKGAFTGATTDHKGAFQEASGGVLFLDEIGELDYKMQSKLLRAIQEKIVKPVGGAQDIAVDVRIICATNKDLQDAMQRKEFREDLFFRVGTLKLEIPPLRERRQDIVPLARHFVRQLSDGARTLSSGAEERLLSHAWPGNVRELRSCIEQAVVFAAGTAIQADELSLGGSGEEIDLSSDLLAEAEKRHILAVLEKVNGNKTEAAKVLGIGRSTLAVKLKSYGGG